MPDHMVLFDDDPEIGRKVFLVFDDKGQMKGAHVEQEVDALLEENAEAEKATHGRLLGDWNRVASVPLTFMEKTGLSQAIHGHDSRYVAKILNDADYAKFRTSRGRI